MPYQVYLMQFLLKSWSKARGSYEYTTNAAICEAKEI